MAVAVPMAYVAERRIERARIVDLARRAAGRIMVYRRPRCERCDGWLYIDQETTTDACYEVACLRCGNRAYLDVTTLQRPVMMAVDPDAPPPMPATAQTLLATMQRRRKQKRGQA